MTKDEARRSVGKRVEDLSTGHTGIVQAAEDWENPETRRVAFTVFVRPEHGGTESYLSPANVRPVVIGS
ncbi:hypothetical protein AB0M39_41555 [Streptomyces sp. NPDC051907]|uniref:hypothetical protein n=1 Tax=Streptomyces sp. NPDC051907 TaxID=3155284 RepID=UPI003425DEA6